MNTKQKLNRNTNWFTSIRSWTSKVIKLSIIGIILILILCLWIYFINALLEATSSSQLYTTAFYGIFYLIIWVMLPALGLQIAIRTLRSYLNKT